MTADGYTVNAGADWIGWVYENIDTDTDTDTDTDGDGLIDGFEQILGTDPNNINSDCDIYNDGVEYPLTGIPVSDPVSPIYSGTPTLNLVNHTLTGAQASEACSGIRIWPTFVIATGGSLDAKAGKWIELKPGFTVAAGGILSAKVGE